MKVEIVPKFEGKKIYCNCFPFEKHLGENPLTNKPYMDEVIRMGGLLLVQKRTDKTPDSVAIVGELTNKDLNKFKELCPEIFEEVLLIVDEKVEVKS